MTTHLPRTLLAATLLLVGAACNKNATTGGSAAGKANPNTTVATFGNEKITLAELDEKIGPRLHDLRRETLERMVMEKIVEAEAKKRGMTEEQLFKAEIDDKVPPANDEQIAAVFEQSKAQLPPGATLEQFKEQISNFLNQRPKQERMRQFIGELRTQANVKITLPEPRVEVAAKGPSRGPDNAKVTIVAFSDFQCPFCSKANEAVDQVMEQYAGKVKLHFRHFPLSFHDKAPKAAEASACANEQGKFWEYHDVLFKNQSALDVADLKTHAKSVGLDEAKFAECLDSGKHAKTVKEDMSEGEKAGVTGTPAFFINGIMLSGAQPAEEFKRIIDQELAAK